MAREYRTGTGVMRNDVAPRADADERLDELDEDAAARRALRRQVIRDAESMGFDGEAAGREFDRDAAHRQVQDATVRANGTRRLDEAHRADGGDIDEDAAEHRSLGRLDGAWRGGVS